ENAVRLAAQGIVRVRLIEFVQVAPYFVARIEPAPEPREGGVELDALVRAAKERFVRFVQVSPEFDRELANAAEKMGEPRQLAYLVAAAVPLTTRVRQEILELDLVSARLRRLVLALQHEIAVRELIERIAAETAEDLTKAQREIVLRKQIEAIQRELGE